MVGKDNEYVSHYSAPGAMRAGFEYYRAFPHDAIQNMNYSNPKLTMPVLALGVFVAKLLSNFFSGNSTTETSK